MSHASLLAPPLHVRTTIASLLLQCGCYATNPQLEVTPAFTWRRLVGTASAACDCRILNGFPPAANVVAEQLAKCAQEWLGEIDLIVGVESAGVPWATRVATLLSCPLISANVNGNGTTRINAGGIRLRHDLRAVLIDDSVVFGETLADAVDLLQHETSIKATAVLTITNWQTDHMDEALSLRRVKIGTLVDAHSILTAAYASGLIDMTQRSRLEEFYSSLDERYVGGPLEVSSR
jgi:orotate phosphoribosyltransferase